MKKKSLRITVMAVAICVILGTWAAAFAKAETEKAGTAAQAAATIQTDAVSAGASVVAVSTGTAIFQRSDLFTDRDLLQIADLSKAVTYTVADGQDIAITAAGTYVLTGSARNVTVTVEADKEDKVQLVLEGLDLTNDDAPAIYVKSADKVFVTTATDSALSVTGSFVKDGDTNLDGVIFSKSDLTLNGTGTLTVASSKNGVVGKDDLKVTGGTYVISANKKALEANDSIRIADGVLELTAGTDGLHAENDENDTTGYIYIGGGTVAIRCGDDAIHATSVVQVDGGDLTISAAEGIEATYVQLNGGTVSITSSDDGINAAQKSSAYRATVEIYGGDIAIVMGAGDTDGVDSNGDIIVNGGTISVSGNSTFDYDGTAQYTGGTILANGQQIDYIPNQMMGGGMGGWGGFGGGWGGNGGFGGGNGGFGGGRRGW